MGNRSTAAGSRRMLLLNGLAITTALAATGTTPQVGLLGINYLSVQATFIYGSGGTSFDAYIQTSLDGGTTWIDIMNFHFTTASAVKASAVTVNIALGPAVTPTDGSLAANTILNGVLGDKIRAKYVSVGTYAGNTSATISAVAVGG